MDVNLKELVAKVKQSLAKAPDGHLLISSSRRYPYFFWVTSSGKKRLFSV